MRSLLLIALESLNLHDSGAIAVPDLRRSTAAVPDFRHDSASTRWEYPSFIYLLALTDLLKLGLILVRRTRTVDYGEQLYAGLTSAINCLTSKKNKIYDSCH